MCFVPKLVIPADAPRQFGLLIESCWNLEPKARPPFRKITHRLRKQAEINGGYSNLGALLKAKGNWLKSMKHKHEIEIKQKRDAGERVGRALFIATYREAEKDRENQWLQTVNYALWMFLFLLLYIFLTSGHLHDSGGAVSAAFHKNKGVDSVLSRIELDSALAVLVSRRLLDDDALVDAARIMSSYDGTSEENQSGLDETEFGFAIATEMSHYGQIRRGVSRAWSAIFTTRSSSLGAEVCSAKRFAWTDRFCSRSSRPRRANLVRIRFAWHFVWR